MEGGKNIQDAKSAKESQVFSFANSPRADASKNPHEMSESKRGGAELAEGRIAEGGRGVVETEPSMFRSCGFNPETQRFPPRTPQLCVSLKSHCDASALQIHLGVPGGSLSSANQKSAINNRHSSISPSSLAVNTQVPREDQNPPRLAPDLLPVDLVLRKSG